MYNIKFTDDWGKGAGTRTYARPFVVNGTTIRGYLYVCRDAADAVSYRCMAFHEVRDVLRDELSLSTYRQGKSGLQAEKAFATVWLFTLPILENFGLTDE